MKINHAGNYFAGEPGKRTIIALFTRYEWTNLFETSCANYSYLLNLHD